MVICLERGADLHMAQLMPLPLTVSCFTKIQIGFTFLVQAHLGSPRQRATKRMYVCMSLSCYWLSAFVMKECLHCNYVVDVSGLLVHRKVSQTLHRSRSVIPRECAVPRNALTIWDRADSWTRQGRSSPLRVSSLNCCLTSTFECVDLYIALSSRTPRVPDALVCFEWIPETVCTARWILDKILERVSGPSGQQLRKPDCHKHRAGNAVQQVGDGWRNADAVACQHSRPGCGALTGTVVSGHSDTGELSARAWREPGQGHLSSLHSCLVSAENGMVQISPERSGEIFAVIWLRFAN